jgi:lambda repressor-like predicted transcriptional regulator
MARKNRRLADLVERDGRRPQDLAIEAGVDPKTLERWISLGRPPHRDNGEKMADLLGVPPAFIWPTMEWSARGTAELLALYDRRAALSPATVRGLISSAEERIDVLAYAATWLWDSVPGVCKALSERAANGVRVRLCLGDPKSPAVRRRGQEEGIGDGMAARCNIAISHAAKVSDAELRLTDTCLYGSIYRFDSDVLWNAHLYGQPAGGAPVLWLQAGRGEDGVVAAITESFERVWELSTEAVAATAGYR